MYKTLTEAQLLRLYKGKESVIKNLLTHLVKQGRIHQNSETKCYSIEKRFDDRIDAGMLAAFWVMLDFIDKVEFHSAGDFPVKLSFFTGGELFEIVHVASGNEALVCHTFGKADDSGTRRIIVLDNIKQIEKIDVPNTSGYCTVNPDGDIRYYKLE